MKYEKPEISQKVQLEGAMGEQMPIKNVRSSMIDYIPL